VRRKFHRGGKVFSGIVENACRRSIRIQLNVQRADANLGYQPIARTFAEPILLRDRFAFCAASTFYVTSLLFLATCLAV
jgi:hypothetical protein